MAKKRPLFGVSNYVKRTRKKRPGRHSKRPNKNTKEFHRKRYRGQGRWNDLIFIQMENLFQEGCHKILDYHNISENLKVEEVVGIVGNLAIGIPFAIFIKVLELKMFMFAINGDQDTLKDEISLYPVAFS